MLARLRKAQQENEGGFTLIELLVVVIIIGILAAIAIPTFLNQREKAWAKASQSDLRNAATVMETYFSDAGTYAANAALSIAPDAGAYAFKESDDVTLTIGATETTATAYCISAAHAKLTDVYVLRSGVGKPQLVGAGGVANCS